MDGGGYGGGNNNNTEEIMSQVKTELSMAYAQEFYSTVRDKCFNKCITRPSTSLSSSEQACLARCCDRYVEATGVVSKAMLQAGQAMQQ